MKKNFLFISLLFATTFLCAEVANSVRYVWVGDISQTSLDRLKQRLHDTESKIQELEFRDSRGASTAGGRISTELVAVIEENNINTFVQGQCASACAIAFMAGKKRTLLPSKDGVITYLHIHPLRNGRTGEINYGGTDKDLKMLVEKSEGKLNIEFFEKIYETKNAQGGIFVFSEPFLTTHGKHYVVFCLGDEFLLPRTCAPIQNITPNDFGISILGGRFQK